MPSAFNSSCGAERDRVGPVGARLEQQRDRVMAGLQLLDLLVREGQDAGGLAGRAVGSDRRGHLAFEREFAAHHLVGGLDQVRGP